MKTNIHSLSHMTFTSCLSKIICLSVLLSLCACNHMPVEASPTLQKTSKILIAVDKTQGDQIDHIKQRLDEQFRLQKLSAWPLDSLNLHCLIYQVNHHSNLSELFNQIRQDKRITLVQEVKSYEVLSQTSAYNDQHFPLQYSAKNLDLDQAHRWSTGKGVKVAVIDTGVDSDHQDLKHNIASTRNFVGKASTQNFPETHGTAIAGIIAAQADNQHGIVGVAPDAQIVGLRACWQVPSNLPAQCNTLSLAKAIDYANMQGIEILNLSLHGPNDPIVAALINKAISSGAIVIAAYKSDPLKPFPANLTGVIAVSDSPVFNNNSKNFDDYVHKNVHKNVDNYIDKNAVLPATLMIAPGEDVITTTPANQYELLNGSSLSAAHISGIVALIKQHKPNASAKDIAQLFISSNEILKTNHRTKRPIRGTQIRANACESMASLLGTKC